MKLFRNFNKPVRLRKKYTFLKQLSDYKVSQKLRNYSVTSYLVSIYDEIQMTHNVVYLFSIYNKVTHYVLYLFSTPNLGNSRADMTNSPLALNQSNLLKYFQ